MTILTLLANAVSPSRPERKFWTPITPALTAAAVSRGLFRARAADDLGFPPEGSVIADVLSDYAVMREQARACG